MGANGIDIFIKRNFLALWIFSYDSGKLKLLSFQEYKIYK